MDMDVTAAERSALRSGLAIEIFQINHATVPAGTVIMQSPEAGTTLKKGDTVVLTVSKGPASLTVPVLTGKSLSEAITVAQSSGLTLTVVEYVVSQDVQADMIMTQIPAAGTQCQTGDIVQVTVSGGLVNIPDVTGGTLAAARETLTASGLSVSGSVTYVETTDASLHGLVASQTPAASSQVIQGTTVYLSIYQVPGLTRSADVLLTLPERNEAIAVRVTLVVDGV